MLCYMLWDFDVEICLFKIYFFMLLFQNPFVDSHGSYQADRPAVLEASEAPRKQLRTKEVRCCHGGRQEAQQV